MNGQIGQFVALPAFGRLKRIAVEYATRNGLKVRGPGGKEMLDLEAGMRWAAETHPVEWAAMLQEAAEKKQAGVAGLR
jgi:hypothetical protein